MFPASGLPHLRGYIRMIYRFYTERGCFSLSELNGMSTAETAESLEISEANVKIRLNRARRMLREELGTMYSPQDIFDFNLIYCDSVVNKVMKGLNNLQDCSVHK